MQVWKRSGITKVATRPELFPCAEVIGWILSQTGVIADFTTPGESHFVWPSPIPL